MNQDEIAKYEIFENIIENTFVCKTFKIITNIGNLENWRIDYNEMEME